MKMADFNGYEQNLRMYGGTAGRKMGITYNGKNYILKFPGNLKEQGMKNIQLSYSNSPVCEFIGSQIYEKLGFPVHETILGGEKQENSGCVRGLFTRQKKFYHKIIEYRYDKVFVPLYQKIIDSKKVE